MMTKASPNFDLGLPIQVGFGLSGFLLAGFLLRSRSTAVAGPNVVVSSRQGSWGQSILEGVPLLSLVLVVVGVLFLPQLLTLESIPLPELKDIPAWIDKTMASGFSDFRKNSMGGRMLIAWPVALLLAPRRLLGLVFLAFLGSGLMIQFSALLSREIHPVSVLVNPSTLDLLSGGALVAAMFHGGSDSETGQLGRWAILMGLVLAITSVSLWYQKGLPNWGTISLLSAPRDFGAVNFILEIIGTTLVASLSWRDLGDLMGGSRRSHVH